MMEKRQILTEASFTIWKSLKIKKPCAFLLRCYLTEDTKRNHEIINLIERRGWMREKHLVKREWIESVCFMR